MRAPERCRVARRSGGGRRAGLLLVSLLGASTAWPEPAPASTPPVKGELRVLRGGAAGPPEITLHFERRVTFVLPGPVRLAVPGSPDVLSAHARDNLVVATLVDSPYVRQRRPITNLTILTEDGVPFSCRILVAARPDDATVDLVRVEPAPDEAARAGEQAVRLLEAWLAGGDAAVAPDLAARLAALRPALSARARRELADGVAAEGIAVADGSTRRTKRAFIYLSAGAAARVGRWAVWRLELANHSQAPFELERVALSVDGETLTEGVVVSTPEPVVAADGRPRVVAIVAPWSGVEGRAIAVEICERAVAARCVALELR